MSNTPIECKACLDLRLGHSAVELRPEVGALLVEFSQLLTILFRAAFLLRSQVGAQACYARIRLGVSGTSIGKLGAPA